MANEPNLHIAVFPWLAFGHILPYFSLSKSLAERGHHISFISTPKNLQRLPKIPQDLSPSLNLVPLPLPLPHISNLPQNAESTTDLSPHQAIHLIHAFDLLKDPLIAFLQHHSPDWIIHDYAPHWLPPITKKLRIPCAYFNIFNASMVAFYGSCEEMMRDDGGSRSKPEDFTVPPKWIPFPSNLALRLHEAQQILVEPDGSNKRSVYRLGSVIRGSDLMVVRTCVEFEEEWMRLLKQEICPNKPVLAVGVLPPLAHDSSDPAHEDEQYWEWLDEQETGSVVYIALGSEATLSQEQVSELARGLESSELPFFWVLRRPPDSLEIVPEGFEERVKGRGVVCTSWAPQLRILVHRSVGGFLTHCGWSSVIEGLAYGLALVLLPMSQPQALNARVLEWKKMGLEIRRDERDGSFTSESVAESLRTVMVDEPGESFRMKAKEMRGVFGDKERHDRYVDEFVRFLKDNTHRGG